MRESSTYQAILAEGRAEGEREMLIPMASEKLGPPDAAARAALEAVTEPARLVALGARVWKVSTWAELIGPDAS